MRFRFGDCVLDTEARELRRGGVARPLGPKGLQLLELVILERPRAISKPELHERLWPDSFVADSSLARLASEVRAAIGDDARKPRLLRTVHRHGYSFSGAVVVGASAGAPLPAPCRLVWGERQIALHEGENLIGRAADAVVQIDVGRVSRRHARIVVEAGRGVLEDLESKNGTFHRGTRIHAPVELADGDPIGVGPVLLLFRTPADRSTTETGTAQ